ncbi:pyruvate dehydrogenase complex dihydrolipoamide acetyltransferase [Rhizobium glycinendophyticum]|uniref:Acetyltransferase component of pyruvate dehydrogenase complex n=1 Tax=Rhizobium glycinendophyticum TaxID=2589807 RepID=A0A504UFI0_9HYPH|nr:pyruvate dehydrogenase complex dihydrolipoamide acetyltransferase [Rhizobium glycinendophyticum]TPP04242.1 pyruvate dehydrogenase complex dihydrolipoamide acetyltransferase [Rhizobium glycinendophyticum]
MATEIILPKVDMDMATGKISKWFFSDGDRVKKGDVLFEIETDKAAMEIDSPATGILRNVVGQEGLDIPVGSAVAWVYEEGEAYFQGTGNAPDTNDAAQNTVELIERASVPPVEAGVHRSIQTKVPATPLAKRLARERGIDLAMVAGSGPRGRVVSADLASVSLEERQPPASETTVARPDVAGGVSKHFADGSFDLQPHTSMRKTIARRLAESKATVPHFYLSADCKLDALLKLRTELNASSPVVDGVPSFKLSVNDMVIKAYALALRSTPDANVSWTEDNLVLHRSVDVGVAVSVPNGLITPIVRNADAKTLSTISGEMRDLATRARAGKLKTTEYQGGTGAISNLGMYGVDRFAAIINPPHSTILAVGAGDRRPVVNADGDLAVASVMTVTLSTDHRAVDGALGAELLAKFRTYIENPLSMLA